MTFRIDWAERAALFEWDEAKRRTNLIKHRLDFLDVAALFDGRPRLEGPAAYREEARLVTVAMLDGVFVALIWTWRDDKRRVISFRRARDGEREAYRRLFAGRVEGDD